MFYVALVSIVCVIVESELFWLEWESFEAESDANLEFPYSPTFIALKIVLSSCSFLLLVGLAWRYYLRCRILVETKQLPPGTLFFQPSSGLLVRFLVEAVICTVHIPLLGLSHRILYLHHSYLEHLDQLDVVVFIRIYLIARFLRNTIGYGSRPHDARLIGRLHQVDVSSVWFAAKYAFQKLPFVCTAGILVIDWILTASALNFFERGSNARLPSVNEAIWMTIVTITGVGYGEVSPTTLNGKLTIVFGAIIGGTIITCLLRVVLIDALIISPQEKIVLDVVEFYDYARKRKVSAAFLIQCTWRWHRATRSRADRLKSKMYAAAEASRLLRFMQSPELAGTHSSLNSSSFAGTPGGSVAKQLEQLLSGIKTQQSVARQDFQHALATLERVASSM